MIEFVLGGARSGKSNYAQEQATLSKKSVVYVATASVTDSEMASRIARHKADRPSNWDLVEQSLALPDAIEKYVSQTGTLLLVDCLTLWLNNEMYHNPLTHFDDLCKSLLEVLSKAECDVILVSNEVGMGIIPLGEVTRKFVDWQGWLNQNVAKQADKVTFVAAGLPLVLKNNTVTKEN